MVKNILGKTDLENMMFAFPQKYNVIHYTRNDLGPNPIVVNNSINWHHLPFDDVDHAYYKTYHPINKTALKDALEWAKDKKDLLVACQAGVSRSSSTAYLIECLRLKPIEALGILNPAKHYPNRWTVYMGSKILNNDNIWEEFVKWYYNNKGQDISDSWMWPNNEIKEQMGLA